MGKYKHYLIYKITNLKTDRFYVGQHRTNNLKDGYMGSGKQIRRAIRRHVLENFKKEILFDFDNEVEMLAKEAELVNEEFVARKDTYNLTEGGFGSWYHLYGTNCVKDKAGNISRVKLDDPRYLNGELVSIAKGKIRVKDLKGKTYQVSINDPRYLNGELIAWSKGMVTVKDLDGNTSVISANDPRYLNGELVGICKGKKHSEETKMKMRESQVGKQTGSKNSQYGTCWIVNKELQEVKKVSKTDLEESLNNGWELGKKL